MTDDHTPDDQEPLSEQDLEMPEDHIGYAALTQKALRGVVQQVLSKAAQEGLTGGHHFYISFLTQAPGVSVHESLIERFPHEMTIVLQNQFRDLTVTDDFFRVTLSFGGVPRTLTIPFSAIYRFTDPYMHFALEFDVTAYDEVDEEGEDGSEPDAEAATPQAASADDTPKVISLDQFRKK